MIIVMWSGFVWSPGAEPVCVCVCVCVCVRVRACARVCGLLDLITVIYENLLSRVFGNRELILCLRTLISQVGSPLNF